MNGCPGCGHAPHAGRCPRYTEPAPGRLVECRCKEKTHGIDQPASGGDSGLPVPDLGVGTLAESLEELRAVLDEPMVMYGGKTTREMLEGERR